MLLLLLACNEAPVVTFLSPDAGSEFLVGAKVNLEISVVDDQKAGALRVDFTSAGEDLDGSLEPSSSGFLFRSTLNLPPGEVEITATATDSSGASGSAVLPLVLSENHDPTADILAPLEGATLYVGVSTPVQAQVGDEDRSDASELGLSWTGLPADAPAHPAADGSVDYTWRPELAGPGSISLTVEDPEGGYVVRRVDFTVVDADLDGDGFADQAVGGDDCNDNDADIHPGADEHCDGADEDCDSVADNNPVDGALWYPDADMDGYGGAGGLPACDAPAGQVSQGGDCNDSDAEVHPLAAERCNAVDDDCDGTIPSAELTDSDGDGSSSCLDCNDRAAGVYPGAQEVCDAANTDEDCDGLSDDGDSSVASSGFSTWYRDVDGDGYGVSFPTTTACDVPVGYAQLYGDCDDVAAVVYPGAPELCEDGYDNDCSGADPRCSPAGTSGLADADGRYSGIASNDFAGSALGGADVDGDGQVELVVGAWGVNSGA
ncbi:MAG TPA: putative metal-binding motif-containing protein, partial [Myxococcota bacterium]|nr:putative metal-binding motif-containing protein [Myxococcota bacterium]